MTAAATCEHCTYDIPSAASLCPHCGRPGLYPNVRAAELPDEQAALKLRYDAAVASLAASALGDELAKLTTATENSLVVINRSAEEAMRLAGSEGQIYATYYELVDAGIRIPDNSYWDRLRRTADEAIFPGYFKDIRFAVLSPDKGGLPYYGNWSLVLKPGMFEHRSSVFECNTSAWVDDQPIGSASDLQSLPKGYRSTWSNRVQLVVAKLSTSLYRGIENSRVARLLLADGDLDKADFVEVHVWGPITIRSLQMAVCTTKGANRSERLLNRVIAKKLEQAGVDVELL